MKTCDSYRRLMLLDDSGELAENERSDLRLHLAECLECRRFQMDFARLAARTPAALDIHPPQLDIPQLEAKVRRQRRLLRFQLSAVLAAAAALILAVVGPGHWLPTLHEKGVQTAPQHLALLNEWQFWLVSYVGQQGHETSPAAYLEDWNKGDLARHLLVLEGLLPDEESVLEDSLLITPGELPPITLRGCNIPELLRS